MALGLSKPVEKVELVQYDATKLKVLGIYCLVKFEKFPVTSLYISRARDYDRWKGTLVSTGTTPHEDTKGIAVGQTVCLNKHVLPKAEFGWEDQYYGLFDSNDVVAKVDVGSDSSSPFDAVPLGPLFLVRRVFDDGLKNGIYRPSDATKNVLRGEVVTLGARVSDEAKALPLGALVSLNKYAMRFYTWEYEGNTYDIFNSEDIEAIG